jgi:N-acyl-D-aspartate/D-glutamate deacylase
LDVLLRGATVIDGTGGPARNVDVLIRESRIAAVGQDLASEAPTAEAVDLSGLVLSPGFIDVHTHLDAQVLWDPDLTPSTWHGVTTVVVGNCGFGIAPTRPEHQQSIIRTLENVEGMSVDALNEGIGWSFETFPEYLDTVDRLPKRCNFAALIGHSPVRLYVMGPDCMEREATEDEILQMKEITAAAMSAGAIGFSSSVSPVHVGDGGRPVPSRLSTPEELDEICDALLEHKRGVVQVTHGPTFDRDRLSALAERIGLPVIYTALLTGHHGEETALDVLADIKRLGGNLWAIVSCRPVVFQFTLDDPFPFGNTLGSFKEILEVSHSERIFRYRDEKWRALARAEAAVHPEWQARWPKTTVDETNVHGELRNGPSMTELARDRGVDPFDVLLDLALAEDLKTRFRVVLFNDDQKVLVHLLHDDRTLISLSDAGAHASQLCDANFATYLLQHWVRELGSLTLTEAVHELTSKPASKFGILDRGEIRPGYWADLVAFDPARVGTDSNERVWDLPAGTDRLIARSRGIEWIWVNGTAVRARGEDLEGIRPGVLIRGGGA